LSLKDAMDCFEVEASDGARLPVYEAGGARSAPALLVGHANGLAAGSYGPWLRDLARDFRVYAFDARGHGGSSWPEGPLETVFSIDRLADDLAEIVAALRARLSGAPLHYAVIHSPRRRPSGSPPVASRYGSTASPCSSRRSFLQRMHPIIPRRSSNRSG
jgi:predicted alpha/beta hydrolase